LNQQFSSSLPIPLPLKKPEETYETIIVGAGPSGLTAAIYLARAKIKTLILEAEEPGGKLNTIKLIENYPGFPSITGPELAQHMIKQAESAGAKILYPARVVSFELPEGLKTIRTRDKEYHGKFVLLTMGVQRKKLEIPGAKELLGMGVSYCPICDGTLFQGKHVALVGEDEETIADGLYLSRIANRIYLIPGSAAPKYSLKSLEELLSKGNVELLANYEVAEITGEHVVERVRIRTLDGKEEQELYVAGVFIAGEKTPMTSLLASAGLKTDSTGCVMVNEHMQTNLQGVYAAGDAACGRKYQVSVSVGQGATAALHIIRSIVEASRKKES